MIPNPSVTVRISIPSRDGKDLDIKADPTTFPHEPLLDANYDATFITDEKGSILDCNWRAVDFFRVPFEENLNGYFIYTLFASDPNRFMDEIRTHMDDYPFVVLECRAKRFDNTFFFAETAVSRSLPGKGYYLFCVRDITARTEARQRLEEAIERLQKNDRDRMEFVSNVSHELRTPLTSMIYAVNNMLRGVAGPLPEKAINYLERLKTDGQRLMNTVNDILDLRQIENNKLILTLSTVALGDMVRDVTSALRIQADEKGISLTFTPPPQEYFVQVDRQKLERVLFNIIGNALKFTQDGGVEIFLELDPGHPEWCIVTVNDSGIGIPSDALALVTQRYYRVGEHVAGTGLGLSIVREIIDLHGGTLAVRSPVPGTDRGTQVEVRLKVAEPPQVYVVTSDEATAYQLNMLAASQGFRVRNDADGFMTLHNTLESPPSLLIMDVNSLGNVAMEVLLQIRGEARLARLPILLLASNENNQRLADFAKLRVTVLQTPYSEKVLMETIRKLVLPV